LSFFVHITHFSLFTFHFSLLKDISFGLQKTVFRMAKDRLLNGESLAFASETYIFRKIRIAHSPLIYAARRVPTAFLRCTRMLEKFTTTGKKFQNFAVFMLKRIAEL